MDVLIVRYSEIGSKSGQVRAQMVKVLRQRVEDRLEYEDADYDTVTDIPGRIIVETGEAKELVEKVAEMPGVASVSPAHETEPEIDAIKEEAEKIEVGESFGVRANRSGEHSFDSRDINREAGSHIEELKGAEVDLDDPDAWIDVDVRKDRAYVFSTRLEGPGGFPVGSRDGVAALISGGIDSPVAAYEIMTRGTDIVPVYFYNKPIAAEDHLLRFKSILKELQKFNPGKKWEYYRVDMEEVNQELLDEVETGRMIVHRKVMLQVAEKIAEKEGLRGVMTGESMGQKSSQTPTNLEATSRAVEMPVHRPLLTRTKEGITEQAREIGTLEDANIESACTSLSPEDPATRIRDRKFEKIEEKVELEELVDNAIQNSEKKVL